MPAYWDVIVIGAGPAGMSAAITASNNGCSTLVLDRQPELGGQIYSGVENASASLLSFLGKDYSKGKTIAQAFRQCSAEIQLASQVWGIDSNTVQVSCDGTSQTLTFGKLIIATGARERPVPVKGWELPGVMGAGAADILLKKSGIVPDGPVVLCGNGPLLLQSALHMHELGVEVAGIVSTADITSYKNAAPKLPLTASRPLYYAKGAKMLASLLRYKIPRFTGARDIAFEKSPAHGLRVLFSSNNKQQQIEAATVLLHEGVIPDTRITRMAGCTHDWNPVQRYLYPRRTEWGESTQQNIRIAGDAGRILGADAARLQGELTALDCCRSLGKISRSTRDTKARKAQLTLKRITTSQQFLDAFFAPSSSILSPSDDTIVCRCEELTAGTIRAHIRSGCLTPDGVKAQSRSGMGQCQGSMCEHAVLELIAQEREIEPEQLQPYKVQSPLYPVPLGELADMKTTK